MFIKKFKNSVDMSLVFDKGSEVSKSKYVEINGTYTYIGHLDSPKRNSIRDSLKQIRAENPDLYRALSLDRFD